MASPYVNAMNHQEQQTRKVLKKHFLNRPLRRIEDYHCYTPAQPVLSCRTINDIDLCGSRTYRAKSSGDIIEEQHRIIHNLYSNAKNVSQTTVRRPPSPRSYSNAQSFLNVQGARPGTSPAYYGNSNQTAKYRIPSAWNKRPKTSPGRAYEYLPDGTLRKDEISASKVAFLKVNERVHDQWKNPSRPHSLEGGIFVKGKKGDNNPTIDYPKERSRKRFGSRSGRGSSTSGTASSFASASYDGFYSAEPEDEAHGKFQSSSMVADAVDNLHEKHFGRLSAIESMASNKDVRPPSVVPLCWQDQVDSSDAKVMLPRGASKLNDHPSLCETHPIVYEKSAGRQGTPKLLEKTNKEGYKVVSRRKNRVGLDGIERENSSITSVSIENGDTNIDDIELSYEDILDMNIKRMTPDPVEPKIDPPPSNLSKETNTITMPRHNVEKADKGEKLDTPESVIESKESKEITDIPSGLPVNGETYPMRSISRMSVESDIDLTVTPRGGSREGSNGARRQKSSNSRPTTGVGSRVGSSSSKRLTSAGRPPPQRAGLHKTTAAKGSSISASKVGGETEYIHFSQHISAPRDADKDNSRAGSSSSAAIRSISDHNIAVMEAGEAGSVAGGIGSTPSVGSLTSPRVVEEVVTPHPSPREEQPKEEVRYAFNIPTADMAESEAPEEGLEQSVREEDFKEEDGKEQEDPDKDNDDQIKGGNEENVDGNNVETKEEGTQEKCNSIPED